MSTCVIRRRLSWASLHALARTAELTAPKATINKGNRCSFSESLQLLTPAAHIQKISMTVQSRHSLDVEFHDRVVQELLVAQVLQVAAFHDEGALGLVRGVHEGHVLCKQTSMGMPSTQNRIHSSMLQVAAFNDEGTLGPGARSLRSA